MATTAECERIAKECITKWNYVHFPHSDEELSLSGDSTDSGSRVNVEASDKYADSERRLPASLQAEIKSQKRISSVGTLMSIEKIKKSNIQWCDFCAAKVRSDTTIAPPTTKFNIKIRIWNKSDFLTIDVDRTDTIRFTKEKFFDKTGAMPNDQYLCWRGRILEDHCSIRYAIKKNSTLHLVFHMRAAGENVASTIFDHEDDDHDDEKKGSRTAKSDEPGWDDWFGDDNGNDDDDDDSNATNVLRPAANSEQCRFKVHDFTQYLMKEESAFYVPI